jgi:pimeloyl-ACP methyl ester carboxylesterase
MASPEKSTNGRTVARWPIRAAMSALSSMSPALAARAGERLFMSPPRPPAPAREREALRGWERIQVRTRRGTLAAWRRGLGPAVLLVHGWGGRGGQLAPIGEALAAAGCAPVLFDAPGHGASPGRTSSVIHVADALEDVARGVGARAAVGHSVGGAALAFAAARGLRLDAAVVVGAPRSPAEFFHAFGDALGLDPRLRARIRGRIESRVGIEMDELDVVRRAPDLDGRAPPLLVLHDRGDAEVPHTDAEAYAEVWPGARLVSTEGLGHRRILRDGEVIARAVGFVVERLPRCACGRLAASFGAGEPRCLGCALSDDLWSRERRRARVRRAG